MDFEKNTRQWHRFWEQIQPVFGLWLLVVGCLTIYRGIFLFLFREKLGLFEWADLGRSFLVGFRYDGTIACYWIFPALVAAFLILFGSHESWARRIQTATLWTFGPLFGFLSCLAIGFYGEFDDTFNHDLFRFLDDQMWVVLQTVYKEYHLLQALAFSAMVGGSLLLADRLFFSKPLFKETFSQRIFSTRARRLTATVAIIVSFVFLLRGSLTSQPIKRKNAAVTGVRLLDKAALNPFIAFYYALEDELKTANDQKVLEELLAGNDIVSACREAFGDQTPHRKITDYLARKASGPKGTPPKHVFYIFAESFDLWPLQEEYRGLHVADHTRRLAKEGVLFDTFYSVGNDSHTSLMVMNTGLPCTSHRVGNATKPFPTSLPHQMSKLGFRPRFFYGGNLSWYKVDACTLAQGFEAAFGAGDMGRKNRHNERGVTDKTLFDFVLKTVPTDQPSFTYIMTSSFHPPYDLDVYGMGYPVKEIPENLREKFTKDPEKLLPILGHRWYADRCLGEFIAEAERRYPDALFVICGDHFSRRFINETPTPFEESALIGILYGKSVLQGVKRPKNITGTHFDLVPTILELVAPKEFDYYAFGNDLLTPHPNPCAFHKTFIAGPDYVLDGKSTHRFHTVPGKQLPTHLPDPQKLQRHRDSLFAAALWLVTKKDELPPSEASSHVARKKEKSHVK